MKRPACFQRSPCPAVRHRRLGEFMRHLDDVCEGDDDDDGDDDPPPTAPGIRTACSGPLLCKSNTTLFAFAKSMPLGCRIDACRSGVLQGALQSNQTKRDETVRETGASIPITRMAMTGAVFNSLAEPHFSLRMPNSPLTFSYYIASVIRIPSSGLLETVTEGVI
jgi:hypothetical protein